MLPIRRTQRIDTDNFEITGRFAVMNDEGEIEYTDLEYEILEDDDGVYSRFVRP